MGKVNNFTREDFEFVKKSMIEAVSIDDNGNRLFNPEKYNSMCELIFDDNNKPCDMAITVKRKKGEKIVEETILSSKYTTDELANIIAESAKLGDYSLYSNKEDLKLNNINESKMTDITKTNLDGYSKNKEIKFKAGKQEFVFQYKSSI